MIVAFSDHDFTESAEKAGLRYVCDDCPGYRRRRAGKGFCYYNVSGERIADPRILRRIKSLVIPPAWTDIWICPHPRGHIQATGRDSRGRKQYRYHPAWQSARDTEKFAKILAFARALPAMRRVIAKDISGRKLHRRTVLATVVRLLETTLIRIGNRAYAKENKSYGLTTLRNRHVEIHGTRLEFDFVGKGGKRRIVELTDRRAIRIIRDLQELPGQTLFQYLDEEGECRVVDSADVNDYLYEIAGDRFTAKDFRTWAGTVLAALVLSEFETGDSETALRRNITAAVKKVASQLGNTPAVCRSSYIHPQVLDAYTAGSLGDALNREIAEAIQKDLHGLTREEMAVFTLLEGKCEST